MNINSVEIELFSIRYRINQAMKQQDALKIIVVTNAISIVKCIFDSSIHLYQLHSIAISKSLRDFFEKILITWFLFGIVLKASNSLCTQWLIKSQNASDLNLFYQVECFKISAKNKNVTVMTLGLAQVAT